MRLTYILLPILYVALIGCENKRHTFRQEIIDYKRDTLVDPRDGNKYATITYGDRTWMVENLRYRTANRRYSESPDSVTCTEADINYELLKNSGFNYWVSGAFNWEEPDLMNALAPYENMDIDCDPKYLYCVYHPDTFVQGACPEGWHIPSALEWLELAERFGGVDSCGKHLSTKDPAYYSTDSWFDFSEATNISGFSVYPVNCVNPGTEFWTSSWVEPHEFTTLWNFCSANISVNGIGFYDSAFRNSYDRVCIRCVKDY